MTDYEDLAFKPAMTWQELCEYAKERGGHMAFNGESFLFRCIDFEKNGRLHDVDDNTIAENVSYERMKTIMDDLGGDE